MIIFVFCKHEIFFLSNCKTKKKTFKWFEIINRGIFLVQIGNSGRTDRQTETMMKTR